MSQGMVYRTIRIDDLSTFYRETGPRDGPVPLLLHGLPVIVTYVRSATLTAG
jgi:hypothetical protein